ncbi:acyltransferase [Methanobrevibacter olleyae]|uniref:Acyltransferase n=1 Tax=Methanobrevibacter olleyae TaxID=294671 RepID=A0A126QZN2_METOL|nr:acyltransferase family protein [Methanobrevibacter olleyae]AMK15573.1 acyltransferase [Methanobrevibacter olleyae]
MIISPKRILYSDEVRSLAIMLVVIGHITRLFSYDFYSWLFCSSLFSFTRIGVPLFFTVSGSLLLTRKYEPKKFLEKRFKRVFLPFLFWIIVYIIAGVLIWHFELSFQYLMNTAFGVGDYSALFWFIWSLIGVYLLIPVISSFIREEGMKGAEYLITITLILSILYTIGFFDYPQMKYNFRVIFNFFPVLGYFIMGSYIHNKKFDSSDKKIFGLGCLMFIVGIAGHFTKIYLKGLGGYGLAPIDFFDIFVIMETIGLFLAFKYANVEWIKKDARMIRERKIGELIILFSSCSFGIYFSHYIL